MPKTTFYAQAEDGSIHTRKTDRTYSHAVLVQDDKEWSATNFCGRLDLAQKKATEQSDHFKAVAVVPVSTEKPAAQTEEIADSSGHFEDFEPVEAESDVPKIAEEPDEKPVTMGLRIIEVAVDPFLSHKAIAEMMAAEFPGSAPTHKSVASVICVANKKGANIPKRQRTPKGT